MADFSHELKTPLTAISGYAQTMLNLNLSDVDKKEALDECFFFLIPSTAVATPSPGPSRQRRALPVRWRG